jgi:glycosyltransferase involved in cell wall biosynthesis
MPALVGPAAAGILPCREIGFFSVNEMNNKEMLVSVITPTYGRQQCLPRAHELLKNQTYKNVEWLIYDDSPAPSDYLRAQSHDPAIKYLYSRDRLSAGVKRNELIEASSGEIIMHLDDDDYYSPRYLERMAAELANGWDLVKLSGWYLYSAALQKFGYWDLNNIDCVCHLWAGDRDDVVTMRKEEDTNFADNYLGYGFSYVYRKEVHHSVKFEDTKGVEDKAFIKAVNQKFRIRHFVDEEGMVLHILHYNNLSICLPQYVLPTFLLKRIFPKGIEEFLRI